MKFVSLFAIAACTSSTANDPIDDAPYPICSSATEQCLDRIDVGQSRVMPVYRNISLTTPNAAITQAVVVVHGSARDANNYFFTAMTAASQDGVDTTTAIVAPHFQCSDDSPPDGDVYWNCSGDDWSHGFGDTSGAAVPIYSYAVIDQVVRTLADKSTFPNLTQITVTGLSGGGQLTQRYAATNAIDPIAGVAISYVVLSPSSYLWLDSTRPDPDPSCTDYDDYHYGMVNRTGYVAIPSAATIQHQLVARSVTYMVGGEDTLVNAAGTDLDTSCEANTQGVDRLARATSFSSSVRTTYGAKHAFTIVPGCMHSRSCMYFSPEVRTAAGL